MIDAATALAAAFGVVFVAELGDKTQLLALGFGARHRLRVAACGLALGYGSANLVAVVVGGVLGAALPQRPIEIVSGAVFLGAGTPPGRADGTGSGSARRSAPLRAA